MEMNKTAALTCGNLDTAAIQIKLAWMKMMLNSNYGLGQTNMSIYTEIDYLKRKLNLIETRKKKIKQILKNA
jgi:hypothetical protein